MIDNLEGGTISLEHNYAVGPRVNVISHETLYEGIQDPFDRPIWIYIYNFQMANPEARLALSERQLRAAEKSREIDSYGLLQIVDHGELDDGVPFLISERCHGPNLSTVLMREGTLPVEETAQLIMRLAQIIDPLHRHQRHHGSITPDWIFLPDEEVQDARLGHTHLSLSLSELRQIQSPLDLEVISHLAPELLGEDPEKHKTTHGSVLADIYALGVLAYRCLVGVHPCLDEEPGEDALDKLRASSPRALKELGVDPQVSDVIMRALSSDPSARWSNAPAMGQALYKAAGLMEQTFEEPETVESKEPSTPRTEQPVSSTKDVVSSTSNADSDQSYDTDHRATITGVAVLALIASNALWLLWMLSTPAGSAQTNTNTFSSIAIQSDLPSLTVMDSSSPNQPPSTLGTTPLKFELPISQDNLQLQLNEAPQPGAQPRSLILDLAQTASPPELKLTITRIESEEAEPTP